MIEKDFFKFYIPALECALSSTNINDGFNLLSPDAYIKDEKLRNQMDLFEENNFYKHRLLFENVALYFDAKSHGFPKINGIEIETFRLNLNQIISEYKRLYPPAGPSVFK
ncbi:hypothetical protein FIA58_017215 [Flavobacterium jejuense]|uniref:Uncharacterized protein n=1 Tax=Flavobacterium jejuense TaxID=1544455 RepID=A0ABX0IUD3_9FLAO|nr:hypothetical protein [Flavobacterium jejuense]NHN27422.1 hypothetical protein [Flavobacterium jejuense]